MFHHVRWPNRNYMDSQGFQGLARIPFVLRSDGSYHIEASRYLRARATLDWPPEIDGKRFFQGGRFPTDQSRATQAQALSNFLEWCDDQELAWQKIEYEADLINKYQRQMFQGLWSTQGNPLKPRTVNARVDEACRFLSYCAAVGSRQPFKVPSGKPTRQKAHFVESESRPGRVRPDPGDLRCPDKKQVSKWLATVEVERGVTKALMAETILETGVRREECVQWRIDTLPIDPGMWHRVGNFVRVQIKFGTKGAKRPEGNEDVGPARHILIPLALAQKLQAYRDPQRVKNWAKRVKAELDPAARKALIQAGSNRLFLSDYNGRPVSAQCLYDAWTDVSVLPIECWHPHLGRHYWACMQIINHIDEIKKAMSKPADVTENNWITGLATDVIGSIIKTQLGHVSTETTELYLKWVRQIYLITPISDAYVESLESP